MQKFRQFFINQRGAFSPYMFGMLAGLGLFSSLMAHYARQDMVEAEKRKLEQQQQEAEDLARGLENAILTERDATYDADLSLSRARQYTTTATGKTYAGDDVTINIQDSDRTYSLDHQRALITTSDDDLLKSSVGAALNADDIGSYNAGTNQPVAVFDSKSARDHQVQLSYEFMESQAALVYQFYAGELRFPDNSEYADLASTSGLTDYWGNDFTYTRTSDTVCSLSFTTPWGYTQTINLNFN